MWTWVTWSASGGVLLLGVLVLLAGFGWCLRTTRQAPARPDRPPRPFPAPPPDLRPAHLRYAMELSVDGKLILATVLDLGVRMMVAIRLLPAREGAPAEFELRSTPAMQPTTLLPFEATLVEDLFGGGRTSLAREAVENELLANDLEAALREDAVRRGWLPAGHLTQQDVWRAVGAVLVLAGIPSLFLFAVGFSLGPCLLPLPLLGFLALVLGWRLPDVTPAGEELGEVAYTYERDLRGLGRSREGIAGPAIPGLVLPYAAALGAWWQWLEWARQAAPSGRTGFEDADGNQVPVAALEDLLSAFLGYEGRVFVDRWHRPYWGPVLRTMRTVLRSFGGGSRYSPTIIPPPTPPPT